MWRCTKCEEWRFSSAGECHCKPFQVVDHYGDEDTVYAMDEEGAALKFAETSNENGDYYLMNDSVVIQVNGTDYRISAEPDVHYSAEIETEKSA